MEGWGGYNISMSQQVQTIGYIGLGIMGSAMAANLRKAGFELLVWNRTKERAERFVRECGGELVASPAAMAARKPDVICLNVTDTPDVEAVLFGAEGVAQSAEAGLIVVDHSTISPVATRDFAARLAERGVALLDAPVSGGDVGARNGTLSIMVGGDAAAFARCRAMFEAVGKTLHHVGASGAGQTCKACNQIAVVNALQGVCEAIALAHASDLDVKTMIEVVSGGAGGSWQLANLGPRIAAGDFDPGFMVDLVLKDLAIVRDAGRQLGLSLEGTELAEKRFGAVAASGGGKLGTQAMAKAVLGEAIERLTKS